MRYESYYQKIFKLKKLRDFIHFYRFLFLGIIGATVATSSTLYSIKGLVNGEVFFAETLTYGELYQPTGKAIFGEVLYEYAPLNTEAWTIEAPRLVGNYQVRGKSPNNFNGYYYGKTHYFSIQPKPVSIQFLNESIVYGETPNIQLPLAFQDAISQYEIVYDGFSTRETNISVDLNTLIITNAKGEDVTSCYDIRQEKNPLTFLSRPLELTFKGASKAFDGEALTNDAYDIAGTLAFADELRLSEPLTQTEIGIQVNQRRVTILNQAGEDVSHLYAIRITSETLVVTTRPLNIASNSLTKVYDGQPFAMEGFAYEIVEGSLLPNHRLLPVYANLNLYKVGTNLNTFAVTIVDETDAVVDHLYDLEYVFGTLQVNRRPLTVTTDTAEKMYDGTPLSAPNYVITSGELASEDQIQYVCNAAITDVGSIANVCQFSIQHPSGDDVTSSYLLNALSGTLLVSNRGLTIQMRALNKMYDGQALEGNQFDFNESLLAPNHQLLLTNWARPINAGTYDHDVSWTILDGNGVPVTTNYDLQVSGLNAGLTIEKRPLTLQTKNLSKTYDATPLSATANSSSGDRFDITSGSLAAGQSVNIISTNSLTNVGSIPNIIEVSIRNALNQIVTTNYDLTINPGTLTINPYRSITITTTNQSKIYNDQPFTSTTAYSLSPSLFTGDRISAIQIRSEQVNAGTGSITIDPASIEIRNNRNEVITSNYELIVVNQGQLTVQRRPLNVQISSQTKVYDGQPLVSNQMYTLLNSTTLVGGHSLQLSSGNTPPVSITNFTNNPNPVPTSTIGSIFKGAVDVTANYQLTIQEGTLAISRRPITIVTNGASKTYDGTPLPFTPSASIKAGSLNLVTGHVLETIFTPAAYQPITNVSQSFTNNATFQIKDTLNNVDVTANYLINSEPGRVQIIPRNLTISLIPLKVEYNGTTQGYDYPKSVISPRPTNNFSPIYLTNGTLPNGFKMESGVRVQAVNVGIYSNFDLTDLSFYDTTNQLVATNNFNITKSGAITIETRKIAISSLGGTKDEDGTTFPKTKWISQGSLADGDEIIYGETPDMIYASETPYINEIIVLDIQRNGVSVINSYSITLYPGSVSIK